MGFATGWLWLSAVSIVVGNQIGLEATGPIPVTAHLKAGGLGAICGVVFWLIARRELRPNTSLERARER